METISDLVRFEHIIEMIKEIVDQPFILNISNLLSYSIPMFMQKEA